MSPIGSVWMVNANVLFTSTTAATDAHMAIQVGTTFSFPTSNQNFGGATSNRTVASANGYMNVSGCYTVVSGAQTLCYGGYFNSTASINFGTICMTATRIA